METNESFTFTFESRVDHIPAVSSAVKDLCASTHLDQVELYKLELCLVEALNNVIIHSYKNQPGNKIEVNIQLSNTFILFKVFDTGSSRSNFLQHTSMEFDPKDISAIPESGRGLYIMQECMDEVSFEVKEGINVISLRKNLIHTSKA